MAIIFPTSDFDTPPHMAPPPGLEPGIDYDLQIYLQHNANAGNEPRQKLQMLLQQMSAYNDVAIKSADGKLLSVLAKYRGAEPEPAQPPFTVTLIDNGTEEAPSYAVTVSDGCVVERDIKLGLNVDALIYHKPSNNRAGDELVEFGISEGQSVYIKIFEDDNGSIVGSSCEVLIDSYKTSTNHIPGIQRGEYYYKLATLAGDELVLFAAGSHIYQASGLTADVRFLRCSDNVTVDEYEKPQVMRLSFVSGKLVEIGNRSEEDRPYSSNLSEVEIKDCTSTAPESIP